MIAYSIDWITLDKFLQPLALFGFFGQCVFMMRFVVQWVSSEKRRRSHVPLTFWYLSCAGGLLLSTYAYLKEDIVILLGQVLSLVIYARNLMLIASHNGRMERGRFVRAMTRTTANRGRSRPAKMGRAPLVSA